MEPQNVEDLKVALFQTAMNSGRKVEDVLIELNADCLMSDYHSPFHVSGMVFRKKIDDEMLKRA